MVSCPPGAPLKEPSLGDVISELGGENGCTVSWLPNNDRDITGLFVFTFWASLCHPNWTLRLDCVKTKVRPHPFPFLPHDTFSSSHTFVCSFLPTSYQGVPLPPLRFEGGCLFSSPEEDVKLEVCPLAQSIGTEPSSDVTEVASPDRVHPGSTLSSRVHPGSSPLIQARPGSSPSNQARPGSSPKQVRPGSSSSDQVRPGSSPQSTNRGEATEGHSSTVHHVSIGGEADHTGNAERVKFRGKVAAPDV